MSRGVRVATAALLACLGAALTVPVRARDARAATRALRRPPAVVADVETATGPMGDNTYCDACEYLVREVASDGCSLACQQMPPPADALCAWLLQSTGLCAWVVQELTGGANATAICTEAGLCGVGPCECGVCTPRSASAAAGRCLGIPYSCGHAGAQPGRALRIAGDEIAAGRDVSVPDESGLAFCVGDACDGTDEADYGCCLTCL